MKTKIIYRIENPTDKNGMWYNKDGEPKKQIHILCPNGIAKDLPMPKNLELHRKDGEEWFSAGKSIENMNTWFSADDVLSLYENGFRLFKFEVSMWQELEYEILFCKKGIISKVEIPLHEVWDIKVKV